MKHFFRIVIWLVFGCAVTAFAGDSTIVNHKLDFTLSTGAVASPRTFEFNLIPSVRYRLNKIYIGIGYSYPLKKKSRYFEAEVPFKSDTGSGTNEQFVRLDFGKFFWANSNGSRTYAFQVSAMYLWGNISYDVILNPGTGNDVVRNTAIGILGGLVEERKLGKNIWLRTQLLAGGRNVYSFNSKSHFFYYGYISTGISYRF